MPRKRALWFSILLLTLPTALGIELLCWVSVLPRMVNGQADFRQLYVSGYIVRMGGGARLYDYDYQFRLQNALVAPAELAMPFIRPPYQAAVFAPFSLLPFRAAYLLWMTLNAALLALTCRLLRLQYARLSRLAKPLPWILLCGFFPISLALLGGQDSILLLALLSGALLALDANREALAGCLLALGLFKFQIVLPVALLFLVWRRWKFAGGFFATAFALAGISFAMIGPAGIAAFSRSIAHIHFPVHYEMMANLHALLVGSFGSSSAVLIATLVISGALWLAVARWSPAQSGPHALIIAITAAALVSFYLYAHDWSVLILPTLYVMNAGVNRSSSVWAGLAMFLAPLLSVMDVNRGYWVTTAVIAVFCATVRTVRENDRARTA